MLRHKPYIYVIILPALLAIAAFCGCNSSEHSEYHSLEGARWIYGDTLKFSPCSDDSVGVQTMDLAVAVRHNNCYGYANLWLQMQYLDPDSVVRTDTFNIHLADSFGNWLGKGIGVSYQQLDTIARDIAIDTRRQIEITHIMRTDTLSGIEQIGLIMVQRPQAPVSQ